MSATRCGIAPRRWPRSRASRPHGLHGAAAFVEYLTDDARLVLETVAGAAAAGALCANHAEVTAIDRGADHGARHARRPDAARRARVSSSTPRDRGSRRSGAAPATRADARPPAHQGHPPRRRPRPAAAPARRRDAGARPALGLRRAARRHHLPRHHRHALRLARAASRRHAPTTSSTCSTPRTGRSRARRSRAATCWHPGRACARCCARRGRRRRRSRARTRSPPTPPAA